jgi:hypothetical protein
MTPELDVLDEVDWYLDGTLPARTKVRPARLPAWAWISMLAHGSPETLASLSTPRAQEHGEPAWEQAVAFLAGEALDVAGRGEELVRALQRSLLIPAELHFLDQAARGWSPGPKQFAAEVHAGLEERRRAGPRPAP